MQDICPETSNAATVTLTETDVKQAYWLIQRKATLTPVGLLKVFFLTILAAIGTGINYLQGVAVSWTPTLIFAVLFPFVLVALAARQNARAARRTFAQQKSLQRPFTLSWTEQGFATRSDHVNASLPWSDLTKVLHNDKVILLCESDSRFQTLPRRCLTPRPAGGPAAPGAGRHGADARRTGQMTPASALPAHEPSGAVMSDPNTDASQANMPQSDVQHSDAPKNDAPISVSITLTPDDLKHAYWLIQTKAIVSPIGFLRLFFLGLVTMTASAVALLAIDGKVVWPLAIIAGIVGPCALVASLYHRNATGAKRIFAQQKSLQLPFTLSWTPNHLETLSDQGRAILAWTDLRKVMHDRRTILFCESDALFRIVPRRVLTAAQQADIMAAVTAARSHPPDGAGGR